MLAFLLKMLESRLFMPSIAALGLGFVFTTGYVKGHNSCVANQVKIEQKLEKKNEKIKTNVGNLSNSALDKRLHKFQRD